MRSWPRWWGLGAVLASAVGFLGLLGGLVLAVWLNGGSLGSKATPGIARSRSDWTALLELPLGEFYVVRHPSLILQKTGPRQFVYRPLPSRRDVQVQRAFGAIPVETTPESSTTTTTVHVQGGKKR